MGPFDKNIDIGVNVKAKGDRALNKMAETADDLRNSLAGVSGASEAAERSMEDANREMYEMGAAGTSAASGLGALQAEMAAMSAMDNVFEHDLPEVTRHAEEATDMLERMKDALDDDFTDADASDITGAQFRALEEKLREGDLDRHEMQKRFSDRPDEEYYEHRPKERKADQARYIGEVFEDALPRNFGDKSRGILRDSAVDDERTRTFQDFVDYFEGFREVVMTKAVGDNTKRTSWDELNDLDLEDFHDILVSYDRMGLADKDKFDSDAVNKVRDIVSGGTLNEHSEKDTMPAALMRVMDGLLDDELGDLNSNHPLRQLFDRNPEEEYYNKESPGFQQWHHSKREDDVSGKWRPIKSLADIGGRGHTSIEEDIAELMGIPGDELDDAFSKKWSDEFLDDFAEIAAKMVDGTREAGEAISLDTVDMEPNRGLVVDELRDFLHPQDGERTAPGVAKIFHNMLDDFGGYARSSDFDGAKTDVPLTTETARTRLAKMYAEANSDLQRNQVVDIYDKIDSGAISMPSLMEKKDFRRDFEQDLEKQLRRTEIPDGAVGSVSREIQNALSKEMEQSNHTFIEDLLRNDRSMKRVFGDVEAELAQMGFVDVDSKDLQDALITQNDEINESISESAIRSSDYYETMAAPAVRQAIGYDNKPFTDRKKREGKSDRITDHIGLLKKQAERVSSELENVGRYGFGEDSKWQGSGPIIFRKASRYAENIDDLADSVGQYSEKGEGLIRSLNITRVEAVEANRKLEKLRNGFDAFIPRLGLSSANLGPFNASLAKAGGFMYALVALLGPLITSLIGLASALVVVTAAWASFIAVGGIGFLEQIEETMAGVNGKMEAGKKLLEALKEDAIEAVQPLSDANLGGQGGRNAVQMFVDALKGSLQILNQFATIMASIVETREFQSFVETISDALYSNDGGPTLLEAMRDGAQELLPYLEGFLSFMINAFPEFIKWTTKVTDEVMSGWAPAFARLLPILALIIEFGAKFIKYVGYMVQAVTLLAEVIWWVNDATFHWLDKLGPLGDIIRGITGAIGLLIPALATLVTLEFAAQFASWGLMKANSALAGTYIDALVIAVYQYIKALVAQQWATWGATFASYALGAALTAIPYIAIAAAIVGIVWALVELVDWLNGAATVGETLRDVFDGIVQSLDELAVALGVVIGLIGLTIALAAGLSAGVAAPILAIAAAVGALTMALYDMSSQGGILPKTIGFFEGWTNILGRAHDFFLGIWEVFQNFISSLESDSSNSRGPAPDPATKESRVGNNSSSQTVVNQFQIDNSGNDDDGKGIRRELEKWQRRAGNFSGDNSYNPF